MTAAYGITGWQGMHRNIRMHSPAGNDSSLWDRLRGCMVVCGLTGRNGKLYNGIINIYKEQGFTSHDVVAKMRGILRQKKIGHTGTLDPDAVGVLPVCLGSATKLCDLLTDRDKEYEAVLRFGVSTDTQDLSGKILKEAPVTVSKEEAEAAILSFVGDYDQIPPMYSALKVNGKKLYELAREGREVERKPRPVTIYGITVLNIKLPEVTFRVSCSKGTYIRTLCHDIGVKCGCPAAMKSLKRTKAGPFLEEDSITLTELERLRDENRIQDVLLPVDQFFSSLSPVHVPEQFMKYVRNGNAFYLQQIKERMGFADGEEVRVYDTEGRFYGVYTFLRNEGRFVPKKMFLENGEQ